MLKSHSGTKNRIRSTLLGAVACMVVLQVPDPACGQTAPTIDQGELTSVTENSVTIDWTSPPAEKAKLEVTVFYGSEDGNTQEDDWQQQADFSRKGKAEERYQVTLEDLEPDTEYFYRIRAAGPAGETWSDAATFRTLALSLPWYLLLKLYALLPVAIVIALFVVPFSVGGRLAKRFRMPDHGWKIGLILWALACGLVIIGFRWPPKLGIDLSGGTILVYEVDQDKKDPNKPVKMDDVVDAVSERVNPGGQKEMTIRPYGAEQIEIIIPRIDPEEAKRVEKMVSRIGSLEFRILANNRDHKALIQRARREKTDVLKDSQDNVEAWWVPVQQGHDKDFEDYLYRRDRQGRRIKIPESQREVAVRETFRRGEKTLELLVVKDSFDVNGEYLDNAARDIDDAGNPRVAFQFKPAGARLFGRLTSLNLPDEVQDFYRKLAIILDDRLYSAPRIRSTIYDRGVIEMGTPRGEAERRTQQKEVDDLVRVLNAGSLPTALNERPIFRLVTGPTLGHDTIVKGSWAIGISVVLVLLFMLFYYRFAGVIACAALLTNLVLILAIMITIGAAFTLPGLAGLVLTVGMAVDANVLIFERIREELGRGAALRMAIRNGFSRATTTIVDANFTTLITGVILFWIGTDVVKGFAITLILGVLLSMYTAIFCSRVVFDIAERRRWITELTMMRILGATQIDFLGKRWLAAGFSLLVIVAGLVGVTFRSVGQGVRLLDIDFTGGVSVVAVFNKPQIIAEVREAFRGLPDLAVSDVQLEDQPRGKTFRINTSQPQVGPEDCERLAEWAVQSVRRQLEKVVGPEGDTAKRSEAVEAIRGQVAKILETKPDDPQRESALQALHQQVADLFADAPQSPELRSTLGTLRRQIDRIVRVNTPIDYVEEYLHQQFPGELASNTMGFTKVVTVGRAEEEEAEASPEKPTQPATTDQTRDDLPGDGVLAMAGETPIPLAQADPPETEGSAGKPAAERPSSQPAPDDAPDEAPQPPAKKTPAETPAEAADAPGEPGDQPEKPAQKPEGPGEKPGEPSGKPAEPAAQPAPRAADAKTQARLEFALEVSHDTVMDLFLDEFGSKDKLPPLELTPLLGSTNQPDTDFTRGDSTPYKMWNVEIDLPQQRTKDLLESITAAVADTPFFPSSNTIGSKVAGSTQMQAIYALAASLLFIVAYIWIRFQRVIFGLAAVVALVHDVLVTLGVIALSAFLAPYLGFLLIDPFKIGLPVLAAFLTIIGYSLNDTIVVFDRIREVRGKTPRLTQEMVNTSINQTLARTLLTSLTTLLVVLILYMFGGESIHAFAFALVIGVVVGTYSSVFVASPALLWMTRPSKAK